MFPLIAWWFSIVASIFAGCQGFAMVWCLDHIPVIWLSGLKPPAWMMATVISPWLLVYNFKLLSHSWMGVSVKRVVITLNWIPIFQSHQFHYQNDQKLGINPMFRHRNCISSDSRTTRSIWQTGWRHSVRSLSQLLWDFVVGIRYSAVQPFIYV